VGSLLFLDLDEAVTIDYMVCIVTQGGGPGGITLALYNTSGSRLGQTANFGAPAPGVYKVPLLSPVALGVGATVYAAIGVNANSVFVLGMDGRAVPSSPRLNWRADNVLCPATVSLSVAVGTCCCLGVD
jgi:hypothetical protein